MMFLLSHEPPQRLPSLYWRSQARLPTGHPLWPARRGTCPVQVLEAQEISGNSQRVGPPGQFMMRTGQAACERYREVSGSAESPTALTVRGVKAPNKAGLSVAEAVERRAGAKGNADQQSTHRTQSRICVTQALSRVRQAARHRKKERFTALLHHLNIDTLRTAFLALKRKAAPGVDGVTWQDYEADLEPNLEDLHRAIHRGAYRPQPSRRTYIPKADGRQRPLAVAALEDKIVQGACVMVLNAIYEEDFLGFSYGFRPGRGPHDALDALSVAITSRKVNYILDADVRDFLERTA